MRLVTPILRPDIHVLPIADLREHLERRACWCAPLLRQEEVFNEITVLVIHNSLDGRELVEQHGVN